MLLPSSFAAKEIAKLPDDVNVVAPARTTTLSLNVCVPLVVIMPVLKLVDPAASVVNEVRLTLPVKVLVNGAVTVTAPPPSVLPNVTEPDWLVKMIVPGAVTASLNV